MGDCLEIVHICRSHAEKLAVFFAEIEKDSASAYFHPHPFTGEMAVKISCYEGEDLYMGVIFGKRLVGYGMLRGWDEGYDVPTLGIYMAGDFRGRGLAELFLRHLHAAAKLRGSKKVLIKVYRENLAAIRLYEKLGYQLSGLDDRQLSGSISL